MKPANDNRRYLLGRDRADREGWLIAILGYGSIAALAMAGQLFFG